ncbi:Hypothetical protein SRAE_X000055300 [Strongyloides ratti]|uniref:Uncharacterized protein n=1 Tax=Strongyloides ratti TaxID=34506 RepID=A0A090LND0_STRRB|nr:Hypothetical protein SRAE_X000055300 [Strongyloides ratti]CEF71226.1 Hypothetical protein SRAE_X000055300 [Strongyloides ratti]
MRFMLYFSLFLICVSQYCLHGANVQNKLQEESSSNENVLMPFNGKLRGSNGMLEQLKKRKKREPTLNYGIQDPTLNQAYRGLYDMLKLTV